MLLLVAVTPPAVAYSTAGAMLRPQTAAAVGQAITRARSASVPYPAHFGRRSPALRSQVFPAQLANAMHSAQLSRAGLREHVRGLKMTASMASEPAANIVAPEQVALKVTAQRGRVITAHLDEDMTGAWMLQGRRVLFDGGVGSGVVLWQRIPLIFILRDDEGADSVSYTSAVVQPESATLTITPNVLGQVLDALGRPIDSTVSSRASSSAAASLSDGASQERSVFGDATLLADMATISRPMHTGVTAVDALTPIGKGQNMLIVGSETLGRRKVGLDTAITQAKEGTVVVYVDASGDKDDIVPYLKKFSPELQNIVVVRGVCSASNTGGKSSVDPGLGVVAAATGATVAEYFRAKGQDTLVIIDDLDVHKKFWDMSERDVVALYGAAFDSPGNLAAANSEMRAFYSTLFQRVGYLNNKAGGGSLSMLLLLDRPALLGKGTGDGKGYTMQDFRDDVYGGKVRQRIQLMLDRGIVVTDEVCVKLSIPPPGEDASEVKFKLRHIDELISLSDGQVILSDKLALQGLCPAVDSTTSLTRIGIGADNFAVASSPAMRAVAGRLRMELAQASDIPPDDMTSDSVRQRARAKAWHAALQQQWGAPRTFGYSIVALLAASSGCLDGFFLKNQSFADNLVGIQELINKTLQSCPAEVATLEKSLELTSTTKTVLVAALKSNLLK